MQINHHDSSITGSSSIAILYNQRVYLVTHPTNRKWVITLVVSGLSLLIHTYPTYK